MFLLEVGLRLSELPSIENTMKMMPNAWSLGGVCVPMVVEAYMGTEAMELFYTSGLLPCN